jgi:hypothetical protein
MAELVAAIISKLVFVQIKFDGGQILRLIGITC